MTQRADSSRGRAARQPGRFGSRITLVRVNWTDASGTVISPSDADMLATMRLAERMLPFPYFETTILGTELARSGAFAAVAGSGSCNST